MHRKNAIWREIANRHPPAERRDYIVQSQHDQHDQQLAPLVDITQAKDKRKVYYT